MGAQVDDTARSLSALGISEWEERVYRWLLGHSHASVSQVSQALSLSPTRAKRLLESIEGKGLSSHTPERPRRYIPASPTIAIEALALQRHQAVQRAQDMIPELQEEVSLHHPGENEQIVELISSREAIVQLFDQIQRSAQEEIICLIRPPLLVSRVDESQVDRTFQKEAIARGVRFRSIIDRAFIEHSGAMRRTREDMKVGEEVRVISHLPLKIFLADRRIALIPLVLDQPDSPLLMVRSSALLDALYELFENLWERAVPISPAESGLVEYGTVDSGYSEATRELIPLLASGLNDKSIAGELGVSSATLNRRVVAMMKKLGVRTRFQAGWQARGLCRTAEPEGGEKEKS